MRKTAGERNACAFKERQRSLGNAFRAGNPLNRLALNRKAVSLLSRLFLVSGNPY
jgi:hypothetical protein